MRVEVGGLGGIAQKQGAVSRGNLDWRLARRAAEERKQKCSSEADRHNELQRGEMGAGVHEGRAKLRLVVKANVLV